jgi:hypothetical protein
MRAAGGIQHARRQARALVDQYGITEPGHIVIEDLAFRQGLTIYEAPLEGMVAQLINPRWGRPKLVLSDRLVERDARRFTIAHELGHYVLQHPSRSLVELCDPLARGPERSPAYEELEANAFASELLMPERLVRPHCVGMPVSLAPALQIAHRFGVSVRAAAIRFTELTDAACAAVLSERGAVRWIVRSAAFRSSIPQGKPLDPRSIAWAWFADGTTTAERREVPVDAWIEPEPSVSLLEHSLVSINRGTVLTMLWAVPVEFAATPPAAA